jgi:hypothetical protein
LQGLQGLQGIQGLEGLPGLQGDQGIAGAKGDIVGYRVRLDLQDQEVLPEQLVRRECKEFKVQRELPDHVELFLRHNYNLLAHSG